MDDVVNRRYTIHQDMNGLTIDYKKSEVNIIMGALLLFLGAFAGGIGLWVFIDSKTIEPMTFIFAIPLLAGLIMILIAVSNLFLPQNKFIVVDKLQQTITVRRPLLPSRTMAIGSLREIRVKAREKTVYDQDSSSGIGRTVYTVWLSLVTQSGRSVRVHKFAADRIFPKDLKKERKQIKHQAMSIGTLVAEASGLPLKSGG